MSNVICECGSTTFNTPLVTGSNMVVPTVQPSFSNPSTEWSMERYWENSRVNPIYDFSSKALSMGKFEQAIEIIQTDVFKQCEVLAKTFGLELRGKAYVSDLIETLRMAEVVNEEDARRLFVIMMVMDGLEIEVREFGREITQGDLDYFLEFVEITNRIMKTKDVYVGTTLPSFVELYSSTGYLEPLSSGTVTVTTLTTMDPFLVFTSDNPNCFVAENTD